MGRSLFMSMSLGGEGSCSVHVRCIVDYYGACEGRDMKNDLS